MNILPKLTLSLSESDPDFKIFVNPNNPSDNNLSEQKKLFDIEVEVVSLNFNNGEMIVKYDWPTRSDEGGMGTVMRLVKSDTFFKQYEINKN